MRGAFFVSGRDDLVPMSYEELRVGSSAEESVLYRIRDSRQQGERPLLELAGVDSRDAAEALAGLSLFVERERVEVADDEYLWVELEGRPVVDVQGVALGTLESIYNVGASDIAIIRDERGRRLEVPLVKSYFDLDGAEQEGPIRLLVEAATFDELWQAR